MSDITLSDESEEAIRKWVTTEATKKALEDPEFALDWWKYQRELADPVNDFWEYTQTIDYAAIWDGEKSDPEYIKYIAENTFVEGQKLNDVFPQIQVLLANYRYSDNKSDEKFNFNAFRMTPRNLGYYDAEGVYHGNKAMESE